MSTDNTGQHYTHCPNCKTSGGMHGANIYRCRSCSNLCCAFCVKNREFLFFTIGFSCPHCSAPIKIDQDKVGFAKRLQQ
jgi:hypothetical protein